MTLTAAQRDRACGALLGAAAGDALGAGYEFGPPLAPDAPVDMIGGGTGTFQARRVDRRHIDGYRDRRDRGHRDGPA